MEKKLDKLQKPSKGDKGIDRTTRKEIDAIEQENEKLQTEIDLCMKHIKLKARFMKIVGQETLHVCETYPKLLLPTREDGAVLTTKICLNISKPAKRRLQLFIREFLEEISDIMIVNLERLNIIEISKLGESSTMIKLEIFYHDVEDSILAGTHLAKCFHDPDSILFTEKWCNNLDPKEFYNFK